MADGIRLKFFSNHVKGSASILVSIKDQNILIDPGIPHFLSNTKVRRKLLNSIKLPKLNHIIISHYHGDHASLTGEILRGNLFKGEIITHKATSDIIQTYYDIGSRFRSRFKGLEYKEKFVLTRDISLTLFNAGHVLGSAMIYLTIGQQHILISGDMGARSLPIVSDPNVVFPGKSLSLLVLDSKNAESTHQINLEKESLGSILYQKLMDCFRYDNGNVLMYMPKIHIPIFIYCLNYLFTNSNYSNIRHKIKSVYLERDTHGDKVKKLLEIFNRYGYLLDRRDKEFSGLDSNQFDFNELWQVEPDLATLNRSVMIAFSPQKFASWFRRLRNQDKNDILLMYQNIKQILKNECHLIDKKCRIQIRRFPRIHFHPDKQELVDWCQQLQHQMKVKQILFYHKHQSEKTNKFKSIFSEETGIPVSLENELPEQTMVIPLT
ncbi:MBL fold metallo-hydrolase [candidate division KSB1 bacterium]|nr:MBL fold metallo-hydrolase [candidate division KSB1 bacterium]